MIPQICIQIMLVSEYNIFSSHTENVSGCSRNIAESYVIIPKQQLHLIQEQYNEYIVHLMLIMSNFIAALIHHIHHIIDGF